MSQTSTPDLTTNQKDTPKGIPDSPVNCLKRGSQNSIHIPQTFSENFLWDSTRTSVVSGEEPRAAEPTFSEELVTEVLALASYTFSCSEGTIQSKCENLKEPPERSMTLFCPDKCGNVVLDSMVKLIAAKNDAEILVLDALELAAGEFGALGENGNVIDFIYKEAAKVKRPKSEDKHPGMGSKQSENESKDSEPKPHPAEEDAIGKGIDTRHVQAFFNAVINIPLKSSPRHDKEECEPTATKPLRRIIYLRDFGTIARSSKPLMPYILHSIQNSRNQCCSEGMTWAPLLVVGITKPMGLAGDNDNSSDDDENDFFIRLFSRPKKKSQPFQQHKAMCDGGYKLTGIIPGLDSEYSRPNNEAATFLFNGLSAQLFLPLVVQSSELKYRALEFDSSWSAPLDNLAAYCVFLCIVTKNAYTETARGDRKLDIRGRTQAINDTLVRICLGRSGGLIEPGPSQKILTEWSENDNFQSSFLLPSTADIIATTAIGLSQSDSKPMSITPAQIAKGYRIFLDAQRCRTNWTKEDEENQTDGDKIEEDPIVKEVKESSKLSGSERGLLQSVVGTASLATTFNDVCLNPQVIEMLR